MSMCRGIVEIARAGINEGIFPDRSGVKRVLDVIIAEVQRTLLYRR